MGVKNPPPGLYYPPPAAENNVDYSINGIELFKIDFDQYEADKEAVGGLRKLAESLSVVVAFGIKVGAPVPPEYGALCAALKPLISKARIEACETSGHAAAKFAKK